MIIRPLHNKKTVFTRTCIAEAIVALLKTTTFDKLKISEIVKKAGVARMTFYKYYKAPYDALTDYLNIMISEYMAANGSRQDRNMYMEYDHILYSLNFFDQYADFFVTLAQNNLHGILLAGINQYCETYIQPATGISVYEMYAYSGGLLNTFIKWEESNKKESAEEVAQFLYTLYHR